MQMRPELLLPEILVFLGGLVVLLGGSFLPRDRQWIARAAAALALLGAATAAALAMAGPAQSAFSGTFAVDTATGAARVIATLTTLLVLGVASGEIAGSLGIAPSINSSSTHAMAQASHGSAPDIAGRDAAPGQGDDGVAQRRADGREGAQHDRRPGVGAGGDPHERDQADQAEPRERTAQPEPAAPTEHPVSLEHPAPSAAPLPASDPASES